jgi:L-alanine-DL-glutamate epimerase-like enolase superfamily enzyme
MIMERRKFIKSSLMAGGMAMANNSFTKSLSVMTKSHKKQIKIQSVDSNFEREPLIRPFGFKGGYMTEIWQSASLLTSDSGIRKVGLCSQSVLWSDASVFAKYSESGGNALMYAMTEYALSCLQGVTFTNPIELLDEILPAVYAYGKKITNNDRLRETFALNALVGVDNAAWLLFAKENNITSFDDMIPEDYRQVLSNHHPYVASIPLMAYTIPIAEIEQAVNEGYFFMKIKIGQPGTQEEMLEKDKQRLSAIHNAIGQVSTKYTANGKIPYYFDANGRYEDKETLLKLLDHADKIKALDQIAVIEEPFPENKEIFVGDLGLRIAADESAHTDKDAIKRIQMGYNAIALKAIAKTLSMTMKIAKVAWEQNIPCFCADLTVNPILVEWNKAVACRLAAFPGLDLGLLETNGHQNYKNWKKMVSYHPYPDASWRITRDGLFNLDEDYYEKSGGIFEDSNHYLNLFQLK